MGAANIYETVDNLVVSFFVPGFNKEQLELEVEEDQITLAGHTNSLPQQHLLREVSVTRFQRILPLPVRVAHREAQAQMNNGILTVVLPRKASSDGSSRVTIK